MFDWGVTSWTGFNTIKCTLIHVLLMIWGLPSLREEWARADTDSWYSHLQFLYGGATPLQVNPLDGHLHVILQTASYLNHCSSSTTCTNRDQQINWCTIVCTGMKEFFGPSGTTTVLILLGVLISKSMKRCVHTCSTCTCSWNCLDYGSVNFRIPLWNINMYMYTSELATGTSTHCICTSIFITPIYIRA